MQSNSLYNQDFNLWIETTIKQIRDRQFNQVDWEHLLEEIETMGKSEKRSFVSNLMVLLAHLLKLKVQFDAPEFMKASWYGSIDEHRTRVKNDLLDNPSFRNYLAEEFLVQAYKDARKLAIKEGQRANYGVRKPEEREYPIDCLFSLKEILDDDYYN